LSLLLVAPELVILLILCIKIGLLALEWHPARSC
jgi:hypothetical protein